MQPFYVFDAYGTLFDVHSAVSRHSAAVGPQAARLSEIWRAKQLEYSWVRTLTGAYRDFWALTTEALDFALEATGVADRPVREKLLDAYRQLDCYGEVPDVLRRLKESGAATAILSNGSPAMLDAAIASAGLESLLDAVLSVDAVRRFKTVPATYAMVTQRFGCQPAEVRFQSSNRWDIAGAKSFGFQCNWINRSGQPDEYGDLAPDRILPDLRGLIVPVES